MVLNLGHPSPIFERLLLRNLFEVWGGLKLLRINKFPVGRETSRAIFNMESFLTSFITYLRLGGLKQRTIIWGRRVRETVKNHWRRWSTVAWHLEVKATNSISYFAVPGLHQCQIYNHWNIQPSNTSNCIFICLVITVLLCCMTVNSCFAVWNFPFVQIA